MTRVHQALVQSILDEAGDTGYNPKASHFLVVAAIVCPDLEPLRKIVTRTRKTLTKRLRPISELKASQIPDNIVLRMLEHLALLNVEVYVTVLDKRSVKRPADSEDWYRKAFGECVHRVLARHPQLMVTMDRRYTKPSLQEELVRSIIARGQFPNTTLSIIVADSEQEKAMQLADAVAWSILQKYEREEAQFYQLIEGKVREEVVLVR